MRTSKPERRPTVALLVGPLLALAFGAASFWRLAQAPSAGASPFWNDLAVNGSQYTRFALLEEMTDFADLVVLGHMTKVERGRVIVGDPSAGERGKAYYLSASVVIDEVLAGAPRDPSDKTITVELFAPNVDAIPSLIADVPAEQTIYFLINKAHHPANVGLPAKQLEVEAGFYEIIGDQAVFRDVGGNAKARPELDPSDPLATLDGRRFLDLVALIRSLD